MSVDRKEILVEELLQKIKYQDEVINNAQKLRSELFELLVTAKDEEWDFISVSKAVKKSGLSYSTIYRLINSKKLRCIHKGSVKYISNKELEALDCR